MCHLRIREEDGTLLHVAFYGEVFSANGHNHVQIGLTAESYVLDGEIKSLYVTPELPDGAYWVLRADVFSDTPGAASISLSYADIVDGKLAEYGTGTTYDYLFTSDTDMTELRVRLAAMPECTAMLLGELVVNAMTCDSLAA